jgi:formyl-CoA transferase
LHARRELRRARSPDAHEDDAMAGNGNARHEGPANTPGGSGCLKGVRIVDLSQFEAGPSCTESLAWLGAEVVKVEAPGKGEQSRQAFARPSNKDSWYFLQFNANKKSITVDLKSPEGIEIVKKLVAQADVFIENMAPGTIERLGLGYEVMRPLNPKLIYAQVKGFGEGTPYQNYLSFDPIAQAFGGIMSVSGESGSRPIKPGPGLGDTGTGMLLGISILGALYQARVTGEGQRLQVAMEDACKHYIRLAWAFTAGRNEACGRYGPKALGGGTAPQGVFRCKGGGSNDYVYIMCHAAMPRHWEKLLEIIGRTDLQGDERYATPKARLEREKDVIALVEEWTTQHDKYDVMKALGDGGVPCGAVRDTLEMYTDADLERRGVMQVAEHPEHGPIKMVGWPVRHDGKTPELRAAPLLGEHNQDVLGGWLGMAPADIEALRSRGVL